MKTKAKYQKSSIWDYDVSNLNLNNETNKIWYLQRLVDEGDWGSIDKKELKKYIKKIKMDKYRRLILDNFLRDEK